MSMVNIKTCFFPSFYLFKVTVWRGNTRKRSGGIRGEEERRLDWRDSDNEGCALKKRGGDGEERGGRRVWGAHVLDSVKGTPCCSFPLWKSTLL